MVRFSFLQLCFLMLPTGSGQSAPSPPGLLFVDVAQERGLRFTHDFGAEHYRHIVEATGSGVCAFDADGDGDDDLLFIDGGVLAPSKRQRSGSRFYLNHGGQLSDATTASGLSGQAWGMGCAVADVDGDGDLDVFVTNRGPDQLYLNDGAARFSRAGEGTGLADPRWTTSAAFADADGDGDLDLMVAAYVDFELDGPACNTADGRPTACTPHSYQALSSRLYRNDGISKTGELRFVNVTEQAGAADPGGKSLGVVFEDLTGDGLPDIYLANDTVRNTLLVNQGRLRFSDQTLASGVGLSDTGTVEEGMGIAVGDLEGGGLMDLVVTNFQAESNTVYQGQKRRRRGARWRDVTDSSGLGQPSFVPLGFGVNLGDFDLDGDLDLFVTNGHVDDRVADHDPVGKHAQVDQFFLNQSSEGRIRFSELPGAALEAEDRVGRGSAWLDLEGDGDLDLVVNNNGGGAQLLLNLSPRKGRHWLGVSLSSPGPNTHGIGALVVVTAGKGDETRSQQRRIRTATSFLSSSPARAHFGLGLLDLVQLTVHWPDGQVQEVGALAVDTWHVVTRAPIVPRLAVEGAKP